MQNAINSAVRYLLSAYQENEDAGSYQLSYEYIKQGLNRDIESLKALSKLVSDRKLQVTIAGADGPPITYIGELPPGKLLISMAEKG